jgi:hypothetical protein
LRAIASLTGSSFVAFASDESDNAKARHESAFEARARGCTLNEFVVAKVVVSSRRVQNANPLRRRQPSQQK